MVVDAAGTPVITGYIDDVMRLVDDAMQLQSLQVQALTGGDAGRR